MMAGGLERDSQVWTEDDGSDVGGTRVEAGGDDEFKQS